MNYPLQQLAIIGPILFLVLAISFPVIGVFGGWKRSVYWGGGNFIFYLIGLLIWSLTGGVITDSIIKLIKSNQSVEIVSNLSNIMRSLLPIIFFIIYAILVNLFLLINYYAWFKRVTKIGKYAIVKNNKPAKNKKNKNKGKIVGQPIQLTTKQKTINMVVGGLSMTALMAPTTFALTQGVMYGTTSITTRKNNKFASGMYKFLNDTNNVFSFMSYYKKTAKDADALFSFLVLSNTKIKYTKGGEEVEGTIINALSDTFAEGFGNVYSKLSEGKKDDGIIAANDLIDNWGKIVDQTGDDFNVFFSSDTITALILDVVPIDAGNKTSLTPQTSSEYHETLTEILSSGQLHDGKKVELPKECFNNIKEGMGKFYEFKDEDWEDKDAKATAQKQFNEDLNKVLGLLFKVA